MKYHKGLNDERNNSQDNITIFNLNRANNIALNYITKFDRIVLGEIGVGGSYI